MQSNSLSKLTAQMIPSPCTVVDGVGVLPVEAVPSPAGLRRYRLGDPLPPPITAPRDGPPAVRSASDPPLESFTLRIEQDAILVSAADDRGRLYAVQTLRQLCALSKDTGLPCGRIEDRPVLADRGYMLDISRNRVPTRDYLEKLLDVLGLLRYNHLELYLEHTFAYTGHRDVWSGWSPLTADDVRWLDREAAARGIELVPNQNSFGHMTRWLEHDFYRPLAEAPDGFIDPWGQHRDYPFSLSPAAPGVDALLADLYDQLLPSFASRRFNVGLDETFDLGQGLSASWVDAEAQRLAADTGANAAEPGAAGAARTADVRTAAKGRVYLHFLKRVHRLVAERERRMLFWADIIQNHPELVGDVPRDAVAIEWGYEADHDFDRRCRRLSEAGLTFLVAPGTSAWNSTGGRFETARSNIASAVRAAETYGAAGMLLTDWGDNGHIPPPLVSYPAIALAAALAWQGTGAHASPDVFSWLRAFVLRDEDGHLADSLRLLNTLDIHEPREVPNASILGVVLLTVDKAAHVGLPERTAPDTIRLMEDQAHRARSILAAAQAVDHEGELQKAELVFCADLALFAVDVLRRYAHAPEEQQGAPPAHRHLRQRLEHLKARLAALWVRRSRRGGLEHSLSILELGLKHVESLRSDQ